MSRTKLNQDRTSYREFRPTGKYKVRGDILRKQCDDLQRRIDALNVEPKSACFNYIKSTYGPVSEGYELASSADRERILKELRDVSQQLWSAGNRPQALALGVILLNIESRATPGDDAAFVRQTTDTLIRAGGRLA